MKNNALSSAIDRFAAPVATILCGLVLLFSPDTATALLATLLSIIALLWGIACGLPALFGSGGRVKNILMALGLIVLSQWLRLNPSALAEGFGRLSGICLLLGAVRGAARARTVGGRSLYLAEGAVGLILLVLPLTASRLVYTLLGLGLSAGGILLLISRLRNARRLEDGGDPNIIDAL